MKAGQRFKTERSGTIEIIKYSDYRSITVKFLDTGNTIVTRGDKIKHGLVHDSERFSGSIKREDTVNPAWYQQTMNEIFEVIYE